MKEQDWEQLTWSQEDFLASPSPWLESKKEKKMTVTYGLKCSELSENLRRVGLSVKMYLESCELPLQTLSRTWSVKAITSSCLILKLRLSEHSTGESGSRLWPTPRSCEWKGAAANRYYGGPNYRHQLCDAVEATPSGIIGRLNPTWVEWLMGFPIGWTDLNA